CDPHVALSPYTTLFRSLATVLIPWDANSLFASRATRSRHPLALTRRSRYSSAMWMRSSNVDTEESRCRSVLTSTPITPSASYDRSEEHTSELQSPCNLV